jgi:hypothetical protein
MTYEIKYNQQAREFYVYDEAGTRYGSGFLNEKHAQRFIDETLSRPAPEFDLFLFNNVFGDEIRQSGDAQPEIEAGTQVQATYERQKAETETQQAAQPASEPLPAQEEITVNEERAIGTIVEHNGRQYRVTACRWLSDQDVAEAEDGFDVFLYAGWNSALTLIH